MAVQDRLNGLKIPTIPEFIEFLRWRAEVKRNYAAECDKGGHTEYAAEIVEDAELMETAADLIASPGK